MWSIEERLFVTRVPNYSLASHMCQFTFLFLFPFTNALPHQLHLILKTYSRHYSKDIAVTLNGIHDTTIRDLHQRGFFFDAVTLFHCTIAIDTQNTF